MNGMKIGDLAKRTGLNASAVRYNEKRGLLMAHIARAANVDIPTIRYTACYSSASPAIWGLLSARSNFSSAGCGTRPRLAVAGGN